jgi:hypothetical protein
MGPRGPHLTAPRQPSHRLVCVRHLAHLLPAMSDEERQRLLPLLEELRLRTSDANTYKSKSGIDPAFMKRLKAWLEALHEVIDVFGPRNNNPLLNQPGGAVYTTFVSQFARVCLRSDGQLPDVFALLTASAEAAEAAATEMLPSNTYTFVTTLQAGQVR